MWKYVNGYTEDGVMVENIQNYYGVTSHFTKAWDHIQYEVSCIPNTCLFLMMWTI